MTKNGWLGQNFRSKGSAKIGVTTFRRSLFDCVRAYKGSFKNCGVWVLLLYYMCSRSTEVGKGKARRSDPASRVGPGTPITTSHERRRRRREVLFGGQLCVWRHRSSPESLASLAGSDRARSASPRSRRVWPLVVHFQASLVQA